MEYNHNVDTQFSSLHQGTNQVSLKSEHGNIYFCPMNCELDRTYPVPGHCPVCNMNLVPVDVD